MLPAARACFGQERLHMHDLINDPQSDAAVPGKKAKYLAYF
jgi:hypothetical protein